MLRLKRRLLKELEAVEQKLSFSDVSTRTQPEASTKVPSPPTRVRPVRDVVLDALDDLGWPAYSREIAQYCEARYGRTIESTRFGALRADEVKSFRHPARRPRPVWLCNAITADHGEAIKRLLARSDWPLERRIVAPTTGRVQHLMITARLCEIAETADKTAADPDRLRMIAADHARDIPGVRLRKAQFLLEDWRNLASAELAKVIERDEHARQTAARWLADRDEFYRLFGTDLLEGGDAAVEFGSRNTGTPAALRVKQ